VYALKLWIIIKVVIGIIRRISLRIPCHEAHRLVTLPIMLYTQININPRSAVGEFENVNLRTGHIKGCCIPSLPKGQEDTTSPRKEKKTP
jgi:hypothetical protein